MQTRGKVELGLYACIHKYCVTCQPSVLRLVARPEILVLFNSHVASKWNCHQNDRPCHQNCSSTVPEVASVVAKMSATIMAVNNVIVNLHHAC